MITYLDRGKRRVMYALESLGEGGCGLLPLHAELVPDERRVLEGDGDAGTRVPDTEVDVCGRACSRRAGGGGSGTTNARGSIHSSKAY